MMLFYLILVLHNVIQIHSSLKSCRQTFGKNQYDLNQLSHLTILGDDNQGFRYALTPCGLVPTDKCGKNQESFENGMTACQERISTLSFESSMGFLDGYGKSPNLEFNENPQGSGTGIMMTMRNAQCNRQERLVKVIFICDKSAKNPTNMDVTEATCKFNITVKAAEACPVAGGLSGGTIFIIILLVLVVVYILGGVLYNRFKQNQTGLALLPHPSFWLLIAVLFVTGCKSTLNYVRNCGRGTPTSSTSYESV
jgi:hypothetical protein